MIKKQKYQRRIRKEFNKKNTHRRVKIQKEIILESIKIPATNFVYSL